MTSDDSAKKPSVLGYAILQLVSSSPASGYDLKDRFQSSLGRGWHAYDTQIYRELKRLETAGYTKGETVKGSSGLRRRLYEITPDGLEALREWLLSPLDTTKVKDEFLLRVWSLSLFEPEEAEEFFMRARQDWHNVLMHAQAAQRILEESIDETDGYLPDSVIGRQLGIELTIVMAKARIRWVDSAVKLYKRNLKAKQGSETK